MTIKTLQITLFISACIAALTGCNTLYTGQYSVYSLEQYLSYKETLNNLNSSELSKAHAQAETAYRYKPEADTRLYLALTLAQLDHPETDLKAANEHLVSIVDDKQLPDTTRLFAKVELEHIKRLMQQKQLQRRQAIIIDKFRYKLSTSERHEEELMAEKNALKKELAEVKAKLRALADIEEDLSNKSGSEGK